MNNPSFQEEQILEEYNLQQQQQQQQQPKKTESKLNTTRTRSTSLINNSRAPVGSVGSGLSISSTESADRILYRKSSNRNPSLSKVSSVKKIAKEEDRRSSKAGKSGVGNTGGGGVSGGGGGSGGSKASERKNSTRRWLSLFS